MKRFLTGGLALCTVAVLSACDGESPTQADSLASDAPMAQAKGGNGKGNGGNGGGNANAGKTEPGNGDGTFEVYEDRFKHARLYDDNGEQIIRECQLNVLENQDGTDWRNLNIGKTHISEVDAYVMIMEIRGGTYTPTHTGRVTWNLQRFANDIGEISWNSRAKGVVGPIDAVLDAAFIDEVAANTDANDISDWPFDLRNIPLMPGGVGDPMISAILGRGDDLGDLEGVECDVQAHFPQFGGSLRIQDHEILVGGGFPGKFKKWIP